MKQLKITQGRSAIGEKEGAHGTLRALGLGRPGKVAHHEDTPQVRGMLRRVAHLVQVKETSLKSGERASGLAGPREPKKSGAV